MKITKILDKEFIPYLSSEEILVRTKEIAKKLNHSLKGKDPIFIGILNGSFMFASDLYKEITVPSQISFLKLASYQGISSTENIKELIGINENIKNKTLVIIEDIVDTGNTLDNIIKQLKKHEPQEIIIVTLLFKPKAYKKNFKIHHYAFEIPNKFIIGYGLDYNGYGRNLKDILIIKNQQNENQ